MSRFQFFPNMQFVSILAILLGILIIAIPNVLEYVIAIILILSGLSGIFASNHRRIIRF